MRDAVFNYWDTGTVLLSHFAKNGTKEPSPCPKLLPLLRKR